MDKYEFNIKVEQIKKLVAKGDFETSMKIADTIDWRRVRNANLLDMISQVYEKNGEYTEAKEILLLAFERAPIGKRLLYKLTELALKEGSVKEAEDYYREFCELAPDDPRQHLLRYMILKEKKASDDQLIHSLERYVSTELDERWMYELAELYSRAGMQQECVQMCDRIMLMFGLGKYVERAMDLKIQYAPLTNYQMDLVENREKYEAKLRAVEEEFNAGPAVPEDVYDETVQEAPAESEIIEEEEPAPTTTIDEELVANIHQAETEEQLAAEMTRISADDYREPAAEQTKDLREAHNIKPVTPMAAKAMEVTPDEKLAKHAQKESEASHFMIEAKTPEKGLQMAIETLKKMHREHDTHNPVVKITGSKLSSRGISNVEDKLLGKDLIIEEAGDLSGEDLAQLQDLISKDAANMTVVLIDNPKQMEELRQKAPELTDLFVCIAEEKITEEESIEQAVKKQVEEEEKIALEKESPQAIPVVSDKEKAAVVAPVAESEPDEDEEMEPDAFAEYACKYASEIDCSITGKSMLALYERIEIMEEDGIPLTKPMAEELIEEAADKAEKPSLGKLITGVFSSKYDKDGLLILKEEHFI